MKIGRVVFGNAKPKPSMDFSRLFDSTHAAISELPRLKKRLAEAEKLLSEVHGYRGDWTTPSEWNDRRKAFLAGDKDSTPGGDDAHR